MSTRTTGKARSTTGVNNNARSIFSAVAGFVRPAYHGLVLTPQGRFFVLTALIAVGIWFGARDEILRALGWGAVPALGWLAVVIFTLTRDYRLVARHWRPILALLGVAAASTGGLGMVDARSEAFGESMGGLAGAAIARYPFEWDPYLTDASDLALGAGRLAVLLALSATVMWPSHVLQATKYALVAGRIAGRIAVVAGRKTASGLSTTYVLIIAAVYGLWRRWQDYREKRMAVVVEEQRPTPAPEGDIGNEEIGVETSQVSASAQEKLVYTAISEAGTPVARTPAPSMTTVDTDFNWSLPSMDLLNTSRIDGVPEAEIDMTSRLIVDTLAEHGVDVSIGQVRSGPTVTMYGIVPGYGRGRGRSGESGPGTGGVAPRTRVRVDTILARERDLALALASPSLRFEAPVPGESLVGIEVPNSKPASVPLRTVMESEGFREFAAKAKLPVALGIGSDGDPVFTDLTRMPHVLVAGATGSGKSVCINTLLCALLMHRSPADLRLVLVDPKRVELTPYEGIPHLFTPTVVEPDRTVLVLKAVVNEMMQRFRVLEAAGTKNIAAYNEKATTRMPYIVVAVDELADLMLFAANEVERTLVRLAQLGRATGVHLIVATQRPSVDVVTGLIKANFPSRIAFAVMSQVDSRTILDTPGADKLLGRGDMLFLPVDRAKPTRIQGAFLTDPEVEAVVNFWHESNGPAMPQLEITVDEETGFEPSGNGGGDSLFAQAEALAATRTQLSTSLLQRRLRIGYPRAARLMDELEEAGVVGPGEAGKPRTVIKNV